MGNKQGSAGVTPLYEAIDPDALTACVQGMAEGEVSFSYAGARVTVESSENIRIMEIDRITAESEDFGLGTLHPSEV